MAGHGQNGRSPEPDSRAILAELRDMRVEMRADRRRADAERRQADAGRRQADAERQQSDEVWRDELRRSSEAWREEQRRADKAWQQERRLADEAWQQERRTADARFERIIREFHADSARREAVTQKAFKDIRTIGLSIVKTLNLHTRILERIDRKLGARDNGRPGANGGGTSARR